MRIFLIAAVVLIVFGIIGAAASTGTLFSVAYIIWFMASFLAYLTDIVFGGPSYVNGGFSRVNVQAQPPVA